jgi:hypothetical protein
MFHYLEYVSRLPFKGYTSAVMFSRLKHASLLQKRINYTSKRFYNIGHRCQPTTTSPTTMPVQGANSIKPFSLSLMLKEFKVKCWSLANLA